MYLLEGKSTILNEHYKRRNKPIEDCYNAAAEKGYVIFGLQDGGQCFSSFPDNGVKKVGFKKYGPSSACRGGKGGPMANSVYEIGSKLIFNLK